MSRYRVGDVVRRGRGKVEWTVMAVSTGELDVQYKLRSATGRVSWSVEVDGRVSKLPLTLVRSLGDALATTEPTDGGAADPLDVVTALGFRIVFLQDFNREVVCVADCKVFLIDADIRRERAARHVLDLLADSSHNDR